MFYGDDLALVHDAGFGDLARGAAPFLASLLARGRRRRGSASAPRVVVDLGCGSGILAAALQKRVRGAVVVGVDRSPAMLALAKRAAPSATFTRASLYDVDSWMNVSGAAVDAVCAVGEPLNYLDEHGRAPALAPFFRRVARALAPQGAFAFDIITDAPGPRLTRRVFREGEDWAVLVDAEEDATRRRITRAITTFREQERGSGKWTRSREIHRVRVLERARVVDELRAAGFSVSVRSAYGAYPLGPRRRAFICRKRA